jgi:16S rRNA (adenine1518-N6/adenine1519-N6)-dimethyltransferase
MSRIQSILAKYNFRAKKRLGQNFLHDEQALRFLVDAACITGKDHVLEIGAGIGNLSALIAAKAGKLYALEKDRALEPMLRQALEKFPGTLVVFEDILAFDLKSIAAGKKLKIIGNLPYYITSPILVTLIEQKQYIDSIFITVQKEVAERIIARPGTKDYGRLSCLMQYHTKPTILRILPKECFFPTPQVDSAFLQLEVPKKPSISVKNEQHFFQVVKAAFAQRRKTLLNALHAGPWQKSKQEIKDMLRGLGIPAESRGEQLTLTQIGSISDALSGGQSAGNNQ